MKTIRLERQLGPEGSTLEWNILDDAREKGMVDVWAPVEEDKEVVEDGGMEVDGPVTGPAGTGAFPVAGPGTDPVAGLLPGGDDEDAEAIARRLEDKYGDKKRKVKVSR